MSAGLGAMHGDDGEDLQARSEHSSLWRWSPKGRGRGADSEMSEKAGHSRVKDQDSHRPMSLEQAARRGVGAVAVESEETCPAIY